MKIIEKYKEKTREKSPKNFNVVDFFKERKNKVEAEASKLRLERLRKLYPTWDISFDKFNEEQLRMFGTMLNSKIKSCQERINMLKKKRYIEEKQQQQKNLASESSSSKSSLSVASVSNRSHLSFIHNNDNNNYYPYLQNNYYPYLQNNGNIMENHHQEANVQVNDYIPVAPMNMLQEFQTNQYGYNNQHDQLLQVLHQNFNLLM